MNQFSAKQINKAYECQPNSKKGNADTALITILCIAIIKPPTDVLATLLWKHNSLNLSGIQKNYCKWPKCLSHHYRIDNIPFIPQEAK